MNKIFKETLRLRLMRCKLLVLDFDGVLTDNAVFVDSDGKETVRCDRYDSIGISELKKLGTVEIRILTNEPDGSPVTYRAIKYGIKCHHVKFGNGKFLELQKLARELNIELKDICYVGNDLNDFDCLQNVGLSIAVADAHPDILDSVHWVMSKPGGHGAVREICDLIIKAKREIKL